MAPSKGLNANAGLFPTVLTPLLSILYFQTQFGVTNVELAQSIWSELKARTFPNVSVEILGRGTPLSIMAIAWISERDAAIVSGCPGITLMSERLKGEPIVTRNDRSERRVDRSNLLIEVR